jgi:hypothetical protein
MRRSVVFMVVAVAAGFGAAAWRLGAQRESVERQALASYRAGRYAEAVPLLKRWAATPRVRNDRERLKVALAYIADAEVRAAAEKAGEAGGGGAGGPGPLPTAAALAQAEAVVMAKDAAAAPDFGQRVPHRTPAAGEVLTMTIKDLGNFPFNPETDTEVPADVAALDGARVRLNGFMLPISQSEKITDFALIPSLMGCCFGASPGVEHVITAKLPPDKAVDYTVDEVVVEGVLHVKVERKQGYTYSLFKVEAQSVVAKD